MRRCLNLRNPHKNRDAVPSISHEATVPLDEATREGALVPLEQQVACQYCKYLLEDALLGDCRVASWVGAGAFGDVYEAEQLPPLRRRVALKVMASEHLADGKAAELFAREVQTIASLDHPHILPVLRVGTIADGRPYLVMKFAAHGSLQKFCQPPLQIPPASPSPTETKVLVAQQNGLPSSAETVEWEKQEGERKEGENVSPAVLSPEEMSGSETIQEPLLADESPGGNGIEGAPGSATGASSVLTPQQVLPYLESAASALQYAHDHGIIHLDVKPANLLLDSDDRLLLADFGVSALLEGYTHASLHGYVGTPLYTAPEQWLEQPRAASDQYALAVTCYQLLTGRAPFTGNLYAIMHGHIQTPPSALRQFQPLIPAEVEAVILRALAKEPGERYESTRAFAQAYRSAIEHCASARTDVAGQQRAPEARKALRDPPDVAELPTLNQASAVAQRRSRETKQVTLAIVAERPRGDSTTSVDMNIASEKAQPKKRWSRTVVVVLLLLLLIAGSTLGVIRSVASCQLGICPAMALNTTEVDFLNSGSRTLLISNPGASDLAWTISMQPTVSWLSISPTSGTISAGKRSEVTLKANAANMGNGDHSVLLRVTGQGLSAQYVTVTLSVKSGLDAVEVQANITDFSVVQGVLQPPSQKIIITNKSGRPLTWWTTYSENSWLVVTPDQGMLKDGASVDLMVTANIQNLSPNSYFATLTLLGKLDQQAIPAVLGPGTYEIRLNVPVSLHTPTVTASPTPTFYQYSAQPAPMSNGSTTLRSGHSMVWDDHDNLLLVFGGIDDHGTLLNDLWDYNTLTGGWKLLTAATSDSRNTPSAGCGSLPAPRMNAAVVWDSVDQQMLLYGGQGLNNHYFGDLWAYSPATGSWTVLQCVGNDPGSRSSNAVWDGHRMLLLGGLNENGLLADFWSYIPGAGWQQLEASTPLGTRAYLTMTWDTIDSRLYVFGGLDSSRVQQGDFWMYSTASDWVKITPVSTKNPPERQQGMAIWDSAHTVLLMTGGWKDGQGIPYYGLWAFDPHQNRWAILTPLSSNNVNIVPGRNAGQMVWDAAHQRAYIYAGVGNDKTTSSLNDLWMVF